MRAKIPFVTSLLVALALLASCAPGTGGFVEKVVKETVIVEKQTVTISYNRFFNLYYGPGPSPLELIREAVAEKYPEIDVQLNLSPDNMNQWHDAMAIWITAEDPTIDLFGMDVPWVMEFGTAGCFIRFFHDRRRIVSVLTGGLYHRAAEIQIQVALTHL